MPGSIAFGHLINKGAGPALLAEGYDVAAVLAHVGVGLEVELDRDGVALGALDGIRVHVDAFHGVERSRLSLAGSLVRVELAEVDVEFTGEFLYPRAAVNFFELVKIEFLIIIHWSDLPSFYSLIICARGRYIQ